MENLSGRGQFNNQNRTYVLVHCQWNIPDVDWVNEVDTRVDLREMQ